jgi:hypothetical protein
MAAKYILAAFAAIFVAAALRCMFRRGGGVSHPQTRTWLLIAIIFAVISAWLFSQG